METDRTPDLADYGVHGEAISDVVGHIELQKDQIGGNPHDIFNDKRRMKGHLRKVVTSLHKDEKEIWARVTARKGLILTVVGTAAFAGGMVGIGRRIRRKGERK